MFGRGAILQTKSNYFSKSESLLNRYWEYQLTDQLGQAILTVQFFV